MTMHAIMRMGPVIPEVVVEHVSQAMPLADALANAVFCLTGGVSAETAADWLALSNVACVGGTWASARDLLAAGDFATITASVCPADHNRSRNSTHIGAELA